ncbi:hypothetical protein N7539_007462 [Penicillium diatomitis]|uniref:Uncharacterized protein n=1 Tax=Penicillium diatomitis TaxID=2819901 RepID=A0A9W9WV60_9EURO|nr:uncharacterized protein N7539_007462 [Penicillium diatomitis]KAJ5477318.1 hypothetical protein N7539_007462 [Penicillium diatomitis]
MNHLPDEHEADDDGDTPRKGWKRLTTKEEVTLFEICNRHAGSFGRRSDLCNWWKVIAAEFSDSNGRPYSWHSVRRKVETLTKKRIKYLEDQQQRQRDMSGSTPVNDLMNPQWCAALDAWLPTWHNWEQAEARRIARRDMMTRKRLRNKADRESLAFFSPTGAVSGRINLASPPSPNDTGVEETDPYKGPIVLVTRSPEQPATCAMQPEGSSAETPLNRGTNGGVRLPPGFDRMFTHNTPRPQRQPQWPPAYPAAPRPEPESADGRVVGAVLETLGKLNKHLESVSGSGAQADARSSPVVSALAQPRLDPSAQVQGTPQRRQQPASENISPLDIERVKEQLRQELKEEFRQEMHEELRRDRAALESKIDAVQRTQEMILEMLRQEPA